MHLQISGKSANVFGEITISGSKSESNRLLILQALFSKLKIQNVSDADDTKLLQKALISAEKQVNIGHAGTAMRFLTAFFSFQKKREVLLTGSERMQERPIKVLVEALRSMGAKISYENEEGFPPLLIKGTTPATNKVSLPANISSQYISALMLVAPSLPNGLEINLEGNITSASYIEMTKQLLNQIGVEVYFRGNKINVAPTATLEEQNITIESDWSSASYFYSIAALAEEAEIKIFNFKKNSLQGDSVVAKIYEQLGVRTTFDEDSILLHKIPQQKPAQLELNLQNTPDLAQTIAVTCLGMGVDCHLSGLHTLKIKETDRLQALKNEIEKFGAEVTITSDSISIFKIEKFPAFIEIATYQDHRMAMAFAPLALFSELKIENAGVVSKSYPRFWADLEYLGFQIVKA